MKNIFILLVLLLVSCGSKKKLQTKTEIKTKEVINTVKTDSSIYYLDISTLNLTVLDSTKPIVIKDFKGVTTTFYNVKHITTTKDKSVIKNNLKQTKDYVVTSSVISETKQKDKQTFSYWYIVFFVVIYLVIRKFLKTYFVWL